MNYDSMNGKRIARLGSILAGLACMHGAAQAAVTVSVAAERQALAKSDDVVVTVTMTNTGSSTEYLLKWQTPFGTVDAPLFEITRDGLPVRYQGRQVKRAAPTALDYIVLKPGASRSARVELSALYAMSVSGAYNIRYRNGVQLFSRPGVMRAGAGTAALAAPASQAASVWIDGRLPRGQLDGDIPFESGAGLSYSRCTNAQQDTIAQAAQAAQAMADNGDAYMRAQALAVRYTGWFGALEAERSATVARHFGAIREAFATKPVTVDCGCNEAYFAYVYPNQPYKIYVCKAFWSAPMTGTDSKGGTLVHEMSHFNVVAGTDDWAYGQSAASTLAGSDPARAVDNADSHEYFGENTPHQDLR